MEKDGTIEIIEQFQHAFATVYEDQIQKLIQDTRKEALAQAKQILRDSALNNVLEAVVDETRDARVQPVVATIEPLPTPRKRLDSRPQFAPRKKENSTAPPLLSDRILEEIEMIRDQIKRNEQLLSQIKPLVQASKVQEE